MTAPNRRALLIAGLAAPALAVRPADAKPLQDPAAWSALVANYRALCNAEEVRGRQHGDAEAHLFSLQQGPMTPKPAELTVWQPPAVWTHGVSRLEVPGRRRTFEHREEVERWAETRPEEAPAVLAAWDAWEAACDAAAVSAGFPQAQRREAVLDAWWKRAYRLKDDARSRLLAHPTLDPAAIRTKLEIIEDAGDPDATTVELANSFLAALGFEERL